MERTPRASAPSDLKITEVKCGYSGGGLFVKIYTNQGIWGCGEGVDAIAGTYYLVKRISAQLKDKSPLNPNRIAEELAESEFFWRRPVRHVRSCSLCHRNRFMGPHR